MPNLFRGSRGPILTIVNQFSAGGASTGSLNGAGNFNCAIITAPGAYSLTPNTLQTVLSHTGRGCLNVLNVYATNATPRTIRLRLTLDGNVVFDATSNSISVANTGMNVVGMLNTSFLDMQPLDYNESLLIEVASSVASDAAANIALGISRETWVS